MSTVLDDRLMKERSFGLDTLARDQYFDIYRQEHLEPEKKLMLALLEDAVHIYQKYIRARSKKGEELFSKTEDWILGEDSDWLFSFNNVCDGLGLAPDYIRTGILHWKKEVLSGKYEPLKNRFDRSKHPPK